MTRLSPPLRVAFRRVCWSTSSKIPSREYALIKYWKSTFKPLTPATCGSSAGWTSLFKHASAKSEWNDFGVVGHSIDMDVMMAVSPIHSEGAAETSFSVFYRTRFAATARLAMLLTGSLASASDLAQDAMVLVHRRWNDLDAPAAYLRGVVVNLCRNYRRRVDRERRWLRGHTQSVQVDPETNETLTVLRELPEQQRTIIILRFYEDLTIPQIADLLELPQGTVKSSLHRALAYLREKL